MKWNQILFGTLNQLKAVFPTNGNRPVAVILEIFLRGPNGHYEDYIGIVN